MRTYLTKQVGNLRITYYICPHMGECHIDYDAIIAPGTGPIVYVL